MIPYQDQFDRFILQMRAETDREITTGSLEYIAYYRAYIEGRLDAVKEIQQEQKTAIYLSDLNQKAPQ